MRLAALSALGLLLPFPLESQVSVAAPDLFAPSECSSAPFLDVGPEHPLCDWIQQFAADEISLGCGAGNYCPDDPVTRAQLAMFMERGMRGTATWEPRKYAKVAIVAKGGAADYADPVAAMADLGSWCGVPGVDNRCLLRVLAGTYSLSSALVTAAFVDVEGTGVDSTVLTRSGGNVDQPVVLASGFGGEIRGLAIVSIGGDHALGVLVSGAVEKTLRNVYVEAADAVLDAVAVRVNDGAVLRIEDSEAITFGPAPIVKGIEIGGGSDVHLRRVEVYPLSGSGATCTGVDVTGTSLLELEDPRILVTGCGTAIGVDDTGASAVGRTVRGGRIQATGATTSNLAIRVQTGGTLALYNSHVVAQGAASTAITNDSGNNITIFRSVVSGSTAGLATSSNSTIRVHHSVVAGSGNSIVSTVGDTILVGASQVAGAVGGGGTYTCVASYDASFGALGTSCT